MLITYMPAGTYYLGDPCYAVSAKRWTDMRHLVTVEELESNMIEIDLDGYKVLGFRTMYGDGEYVDQDDFAYGVDSGLIGLVQVELAKADVPTDVRLVTFEEETRCTRDDDGTLTFGDWIIVTGQEDFE